MAGRILPKFLAMLTVAAIAVTALTGCTEQGTAGTSEDLTTDTTEETTEASDPETTSSEETSAEEPTTSGSQGDVLNVEVYCAEEQKADSGVFKIPGIRINGSENEIINGEIRKYVDSLDREWYDGAEYAYYTGDDYVSLLVRGISNIDLDAYEVFNIDLTDGTVMDKEEFLKKYDLEEEAFDEKVRDTVELVMADDNGVLFERNDLADYRVLNLSKENVTLAVPFTSDRGHLCFVYMLNMSVGAEGYYVCIDTETHEHMLNDFGNWSLYPDWG
ncbi:hypothetical protein SAMN02910456_01275 [Ruminococcaceae bacterium YRB3002]|nr:hypothetical protein SAMN02910456_01275 [Ruminococcaceae bacterium YRB3002]